MRQKVGDEDGEDKAQQVYVRKCRGRERDSSRERRVVEDKRRNKEKQEIVSEREPDRDRHGGDKDRIRKIYTEEKGIQRETCRELHGAGRRPEGQC